MVMICPDLILTAFYFFLVTPNSRLTTFLAPDLKGANAYYILNSEFFLYLLLTTYHLSLTTH